MELELGTLIALGTASPGVTVTEVARSRIRENSGVFRGGQRPPKPPNSHEFSYSPSKCATSKPESGPLVCRSKFGFAADRVGSRKVGHFAAKMKGFDRKFAKCCRYQHGSRSRETSDSMVAEVVRLRILLVPSEFSRIRLQGHISPQE